jgi:hypothetical protein
VTITIPTPQPRMATQTTGLPQQTDATLTSIALLTSKKDFDHWIEIARAALEIKGMENLINYSNLPRPSEMDLDYNKWPASKLVSYLGSEIMSEVRLSGKTYVSWMHMTCDQRTPPPGRVAPA